jgi:hypothetical protein
MRRDWPRLRGADAFSPSNLILLQPPKRIDPLKGRRSSMQLLRVEKKEWNSFSIRQAKADGGTDK